MGRTPANDGNVVFCIVMIILTGLAVLVRFIVRAGSKMLFGADDAWALASLISFYVGIGVNLWFLINSYLDPSFPEKSSEKISKLGYATTPFPIASAAAAKISVLCLYRRIFATKSSRRYTLLAGVGVVMYWFVSTLGFLLECMPVRAIWDDTLRKHCMDTAAFFLALELFNCILDIVMLCLPVREIRKLHMPTKQKFAVAVIFLLGGLVLITGIVRMALIYKPGSTSVPLTLGIVTASLENAFAIIGACLPTYGPILSNARKISWNPRYWWGSAMASFSTQRKVTSQAYVSSDPPGFELEQNHNKYLRMENGRSHLESQDNYSRQPKSKVVFAGQEDVILGTMQRTKVTDVV